MTIVAIDIGYRRVFDFSESHEITIE